MPDKPPRTKRPLVLLEPTVADGLLSRLRFARLQALFPGRAVWALFMFVNGFITIAILAGLAIISRTPFIFPSLGPTAILLFLYAAIAVVGVLIGTTLRKSRQIGPLVSAGIKRFKPVNETVPELSYPREILSTFRP